MVVILVMRIFWTSVYNVIFGVGIFRTDFGMGIFWTCDFGIGICWTCDFFFFFFGHLDDWSNFVLQNLKSQGSLQMLKGT